MFEDRDEALDRLLQELLEEEEQPSEQPVQESPVIYRNFANNYGEDLRNFASNYAAYNTDTTDEDPQGLSDALLDEPKKENLWPLIIADLALLAGILGILGYWAFGLGVLG